jgi:uncharacterized cupin superfamily protein
MHPVNIAAPEFTRDPADPPGFQAGMFRFGPLLGAVKLGASVYELPPGEALCPYHYEYAEEEWLLVLEGTPSVRTPAGVTPLRPFDALCFCPGPDGAHQVRNDSDAVARVLMFSELITPAATVYPDSDKIGIWTGNPADDVMVRRTSGLGYYDGETGAG